MLVVGLVPAGWEGACGAFPQGEPTLVEMYAVPLNGTVVRLQDAAAAVVLGDGMSVLLDAVGGRVYRISRTGEVDAIRTLPDFAKGFRPSIIAETDTGVIVCSGRSALCAEVGMPGLVLGALFPLGRHEFRRTDIIRGADDTWVVGTFGGRAVHRLSPSGSLSSSAVEVRGVPSVLDSVVLRYGLGYAEPGDQGVFYAHFNPPELWLLSGATGEVRSVWRSDERAMAEAYVAPTDSAGQSNRILDAFPRTTGLARAGDLLWMSTYTPDSDISTLVAVNQAGSVVLEARVPFLMSVLAGSEAGYLLVRRRIDIVEVALYELH